MANFKLPSPFKPLEKAFFILARRGGRLRDLYFFTAISIAYTRESGNGL